MRQYFVNHSFFPHVIILYLVLLLLFSAAAAFLYTVNQVIGAMACLAGGLLMIRRTVRIFRQNAEKVSPLFEAVVNDDYAFRYLTHGVSRTERVLNESLNRITEILHGAKQYATEQEKFYELILESIPTGVIIAEDCGRVRQTNRSALRILGLGVLTHLRQLSLVDRRLEDVLMRIQPGAGEQVDFTNERETVRLALRVSSIAMRGESLRILVIHDIRRVLDESEVDSWNRLARVLTHEIMNAVTPIASLSETLLSTSEELTPSVRNGLDVIRSTGRGLLSFVESYRRFMHLPQPKPSLFYMRPFAERMVQLIVHRLPMANVTLTADVEPDDLILYADEDLIGQVVSNLLKNALQAIGNSRPDGRVRVCARSSEDESIVLEISNNGPVIPPDEAQHIFVPFYTTKRGGSGIGLSVARQIMRLSGGSIELKHTPPPMATTFVLTFP